MDKATFTFSLSPENAARAEKAGLLNDKALEQLIIAELERKENARLFVEDIKAIAAAEPMITPEDIEKEIAAYHGETG